MARPVVRPYVVNVTVLVVVPVSCTTMPGVVRSIAGQLIPVVNVGMLKVAVEVGDVPTVSFHAEVPARSKRTSPVPNPEEIVGEEAFTVWTPLTLLTD